MFCVHIKPGKFENNMVHWRVFLKSSVFSDRKRSFGVDGWPYQGKNEMRFQIYPGQCGQGLNEVLFPVFCLLKITPSLLITSSPSPFRKKKPKQLVFWDNPNTCSPSSCLSFSQPFLFCWLSQRKVVSTWQFCFQSHEKKCSAASSNSSQHFNHC